MERRSSLPHREGDGMMKKTLGIIGGMGPLATCDLMEKIIALTKAGKDQDNIHIVVDCNTNIPDRTAAIVGQGESPVPQLVRSGIKLQGMGADVLVMSCNTAHYFYEELLPYFDVPLLHMVRETGKFLRQQSIKKEGFSRQMARSTPEYMRRHWQRKELIS